MGANSAVRKAIKRVLHPLLTERSYRYFQSLAMSWDIHRGRWYEPEIDLLAPAIRPGETAVDLGANYGLYCEHLSRAVGPSGRVFAFEPVPFTSGTLRLIATILRWKNVTIFDKGVSDKAGTVEFELPVQQNGAPAAGLAHIRGRDNDRPGKEQQIRYAATKLVQCEVVRLDDTLPKGSEVSLIKCDIEGAELLAFRGAVGIIDRDRPTVICEINPWYIEGFGHTLADLLEFFSSRGYKLYWYDDAEKKLVETLAAEVDEDNYVFVHEQRRDRFRALL